MYLTAVKWKSWGQCIYCHTWFIANEISSRVNVKYYKLPMTLWYNWGSLKEQPSKAISFLDEDMRVEIDLELCMLVVHNKSEIYFHWDKKTTKGYSMHVNTQKIM